MASSIKWPNGYVIIFDCESDSGFSDVMGYTRDEKVSRFMQFTCICAAIVPSDVVVRNAIPDDVLAQATRMTWWRDVAEEGGTPIDTLLDLFDGADVIVGYNCLAFDFPLIRRFYRPISKLNATQRYIEHRSKTLDIMARVRDVSGTYYKLDKLLMDNGLPTKCGDGQKAVQMWAANEREELERYCATDVDLTAKLSLFENININGPQKLCISHHVHGLRSAIASKRASGSQKRLRNPDTEEDEEFVLL